MGEAIQKGDKEGVSSALDHLKQEMADDPQKQESVADQLQNALEESDVEPENDLYEALENMMNGLKNPDQSMNETLDKAETEINEALDKQQNAEDLGEQMKEALQNAKPSGSKEESEGQDGEGSAGNQGEGEKPSQNGQQGGSLGGSQDSGQEGPGNGNGGDVGMNDIIEDPDRGSVKYGSVYASYFAEFLKQVEEGQLPDSVVEAMNEYLEQLKNQN